MELWILAVLWSRVGLFLVVNVPKWKSEMTDCG
jgi:hypothetical protein